MSLNTVLLDSPSRMPESADLKSPAVNPAEQPLRLALLVVAAIYLIPLFAALRPVTDSDIWWHLRAGQWLVEQRVLPATDPFCDYCADKPWIVYSWLYEVTVYGLYAALGLTGIVVFRVVLCLANVMLLHRLIARREPRFLAAGLLTAAATFAMLPLMTERPWLLTFLFALLTLEVILQFREGRAGRWVWLLPLVYLLWANCHIQFVYGFFLLGIACAAPVLDRLCGQASTAAPCAAGSSSWWRLVAVSVACGLATLVNPYHVGLYQVVLEYTTHQVPMLLIREMQALEFRSAWEWAALTLALVTAFRLGRKQHLSSFDVLLLAGAAYLTFRSRRDVWLIALAAAALIPSGQTRGMLNANSLDTLSLPFAWTRRRLAAGAALVILLAFGIGYAKGLSEDHLQDAVVAAFPQQAAAAIEERGYTGPVFNDFNWGGYLMWQLPRLKVSIDGRANLHGDYRLQQSFDTWAAQPGWEHDPELAAANLVIANKTTPLAAQLQTDQRFQLVFADDVALVFVRVTPKI